MLTLHIVFIDLEKTYDKGMANAPAWTAAPQVHVGGAATVEKKSKKTGACRAERALAEEPASSLQKCLQK